MIIWFTGNMGSGKTTLAKIIARKVDAILLDGNKMRASISETAGFSAEDRREHNLRVARLAQELESLGFNVVVAVIAPFRQVRSEIDKMICPLWIYVKRESLPKADDRPYEPPDNAVVTVDTDRNEILECVEKILGAGIL